MEDQEDKHILVEGTWHMYTLKHTHVHKKPRMYVPW